MHDVVDPFMMEVTASSLRVATPSPRCSLRTALRLLVQVDEIYHLASPASPPHYMYNPIKTIKTNSQGTLNMLGLARRVNARLLLASTSEVYGDPEVHPQTEDYRGNVNPIGPRACYDEGKRIAETMCFAYHRQAGVEVRCSWQEVTASHPHALPIAQALRSYVV